MAGAEVAEKYTEALAKQQVDQHLRGMDVNYPCPSFEDPTNRLTKLEAKVLQCFTTRDHNPEDEKDVAGYPAKMVKDLVDLFDKFEDKLTTFYKEDKELVKLYARFSKFLKNACDSKSSISFYGD